MVDPATIYWYISPCAIVEAKGLEVVTLIETLLKNGSNAMPLISTVLLIVVLYYYRKDQREWRDQTREDLHASIQAMERNTTALNTVADISRARLEKR